MVIWIAQLSNKQVFDEDSITNTLKNPTNLTPWLLLESYCEKEGLRIESISLWDSAKGIRIETPGGLASNIPDSVSFRRKYLAGQLAQSHAEELSGIIIEKDSITFGVWYNPRNGKLITTVE